MHTLINQKILILFLTSLILSFLFISSPLKAQDCNCDHVISLKTGYVRATDMPNVRPGDVICIQAGVRSRLKFIGFEGTKEQPLIFKNCGGQVIFDRTVDNTSLEGALIFEKSRYFHVTGTGSPSHKYGFYVRKTNGSAVHATNSDYELDHIEIADAGFAGIFAKIEARCDNPEYHRSRFTIQNVSIHDNYIHDTHGEGMYIGSSWYAGKDTSCGKLYPPEIHGLRIFDNIVENTGADGIQVGCATKDVEVYNNVIRNYGQDPFNPAQNNGLMIGGGCSGKYYNNKIINGTGMGLNCFGIGNVYMFNNLIVNSGYDGIFIDERSALIPGSGFHTHNNTIVTPGRDGMRINSRNSVGNTFINNLVVKPGSLTINYYNKNQYLCVVDGNVDYSQKNNLFLPTVDQAKFSNAVGGDYQLKPESPAVNTGALLTYFNFDHVRAARPNAAAFDIGAYEYTGTIRVVNLAPVVAAGMDKTITLPTNSTTLAGTASDSDGSIASVNWVKVSGPTVSMTGQTTKSLALSNLVAGTYTFRFSAKDNTGLSSSDDVVVLVNSSTTNALPQASAGADKTITLPTNTLTLTGTASDTDGTIASNVWTKINGPTATLSGNTTLSLKLSNLLQGTYTFRLTVKDNAGATKYDDVIVKVNAATTTTANGLNYKYYTTSSSNAWRILPDFSRLSPVRTGIVSNFSISSRTQNDYFGFVFEGKIQIDVAGTYTFYSYSDDGSKVYVKGTQVVNNDGTHGSQERSGSIYLAAGKHDIKVTYFDYINGETLSVRYMGPGISKRLIPNTKLFPASSTTTSSVMATSTEVNAESDHSLSAPSDLTASYGTNNVAVLNWTDNSSDEGGFVIYMSTANNSSFKEIGSTSTGKTQYTITNLPADQDLYFKVKARNRLDYSAYSNEVSIIDGISSSQEVLFNAQQDTQPADNTGDFSKILVNFNNGTNVAAPWNNFDADPEPQARLAKLVDIKGVETSVSLTLLTPWGWKDTGGNGWNAHGQITGNNSGVFPDDVLKTSFWTERAEAEEILVEGLQPNLYYSFTFFGSRDATGNRTTHYTIAKTTVALDASMNTSKTATISGAKADGNGTIKIYVRKDEMAPYGYLNAMTIEPAAYAGREQEMSTTEYKGTSIGIADTTAMRTAKKMTDTMREAFSAYPNPASNYIIVRYDRSQAGRILHLKILDLAGVVRIEKEVIATDVNGTIKIELESGVIASGYYLLQIHDNTNKRTIKFLKI